ncbi:MAG: DUF2238 domain-containing protein [archaeon]
MIKLKLRTDVVFTGILLIIFALIALFFKNGEFLYYNIMTLAIMFGFMAIYRKSHDIHWGIVFGLTFALVLHNLGGNLYFGGLRLYNIWLIGHIFRYDNLVHLVSMFVMAFLINSLVEPHLYEKLKGNKLLYGTIVVLLILGLGAFYEILELIAVLFINAGERVGDYMNNALDLVFNMLGGIIACVIILLRKRFLEKRAKLQPRPE